MPLQSFLTKFRDEFEYYIKNRRSMVSGRTPTTVST